jgi:hypothetical protein
VIVFAGIGYVSWRALLPVRHVLRDREDLLVYTSPGGDKAVECRPRFEENLRRIIEHNDIELLICPSARTLLEANLPQFLGDTEFPILMVRSTCIDSRPAFKYVTPPWKNRRVYKTLPRTWREWYSDLESVSVDIGPTALDYFYSVHPTSRELRQLSGSVLVIIPSHLGEADTSFITDLVRANPGHRFIIKDRPFGDTTYVVPPELADRVTLITHQYECEELIKICSMVVAPKYVYSASHFSAMYYHMQYRPLPIVWMPYNTTPETRHSEYPDRNRELANWIDKILEAGLLTEGYELDLDSYQNQDQGDEAWEIIRHHYGGTPGKDSLELLSSTIDLLSTGREDELMEESFVSPYFNDTEKEHLDEVVTRWYGENQAMLDRAFGVECTDDRL